jgi:predicted GNAT family acetyltransferase
MPQATGTVTHDEQGRQFTMDVSGGQAVLAYTRSGNTIDLLHTNVPSEDEGNGHGSSLVRAALDYARGAKLKVVPTCPFVKAYLEKHPDQRDIVAG